jgi:hypothetical protein
MTCVRECVYVCHALPVYVGGCMCVTHIQLVVCVSRVDGDYKAHTDTQTHTDTHIHTQTHSHNSL